MRFLHSNSHFPPNMVSLILQFALISLVFHLPRLGMARDTLLPLNSISVGETLISAGQIFELGFFTPSNTTRTYIGIWYKNIPKKTLVWVGNRETPLSSSDQAASFILSGDGNLKLLDGRSRAVWSSNVTVVSNTSVMAVLTDSGNFILKQNTSQVIEWQSFMFLCGVILAGVQFSINTTDGQKLYVDTWRTEDDPAPGNITMAALPQVPVQAYLWNGSAKYFRSGPWNGVKYIGLPFDTGVGYTNTWTVHQNEQTGILTFAINEYDHSSINIIRIFPDGAMRSLLWNGTDWNVVWNEPQSMCDVYGTCGRYGVCNSNNSPICSCVKGFVPSSPVEWNKGNWTDGCVRQAELLCSKNMSTGNLTSVESENDGFWKMSNIKVPDDHHYFTSKDSKGCQVSCLSNCSCTAYAHVTGIGCLHWIGDLVDLQVFSTNNGDDLFIRLAHSELLDTKNKNRILIISLAVSLAMVALSLFTYGIFRFRAKRKVGAGSRKMTQKVTPRGYESSIGHVDVKELPTIDFEELVSATNDFSMGNKIGEGGFGSVFRGKLQNGQEVAVKRLKRDSNQGIDEFTNEVLVISKLQHRNLVRILGCCIEGDEQLIVYEYLPNGSLDAYLFDEQKKEQLNWALRINIIQCIARGLSYLHLDSRLRVIHRDLKASNILLDHDMNPKISDFGLARTFQPSQNSGNTVRLAGTLNYMSPEYAMTGKFSEKSDVYSYGVLALEIVSGRKSNSFSYQRNKDVSLTHYAWRLWSSGSGLEMVDKSLAYDGTHSDEILRCIIIGLLCTQDNPEDRPTMSKVVLMLSSEIPLPEPKQSSFFPQAGAAYTSSSDHGNNSSINEITITQVDAR